MDERAKALKLIVLRVLEKNKAHLKALQNEETARAIYLQMSTDIAISDAQMARWQAMQELQTKIFAITQDLSSNGFRPSVADKSVNDMDAYIRD